MATPTKTQSVSERKPLTAERLRELLHYDPETGVFTRRVTQANQPAGSLAGRSGPAGYLTIGVDYGRYLRHRLAWLYMTGEWPKGEIDHINGVRGDDRFANLRDASKAENRRNVGMRSQNKSGFKGVSWNAGKWSAHITANRKNIYLGRYDTPEEAHAAYAEAARRYHGEFSRVA